MDFDLWSANKSKNTVDDNGQQISSIGDHAKEDRMKSAINSDQAYEGNLRSEDETDTDPRRSPVDPPPSGGHDPTNADEIPNATTEDEPSRLAAQGSVLGAKYDKKQLRIEKSEAADGNTDRRGHKDYGEEITKNLPVGQSCHKWLNDGAINAGKQQEELSKAA
jgi:hypothetical protein